MADFTINGVKGTISGQNVSIDLTTVESCSEITSLVTGVQANCASISPDPRIARDYSQPIQFTLTAPDGTKVVYTVMVKGAACLPTPTPTPTPVPTPTPTLVDMMPTGAVPDYVPTATCFVGTDPSIPICYDPIHSGWSIDAFAVDSAGRALTYSMVSTHFSENIFLDDMRANLHINTATGKITQVCSASCHDANVFGEYLVTVIALPPGGSLPLVRKFKIKAMDFG